MSDDGKPSGEGKPPGAKPAGTPPGESQPGDKAGDKPARHRLNGHRDGQAEQPPRVLDLDQRRAERRKTEPREAEPSVVVQFPRKQAARRDWSASLKSAGPLWGWVAVLGLAVLMWGLKKSGI